MTVDFGVARGIDTQAFGQPGQRTFRLRIIGGEGESGSLWVEKEQLQALSLALKQMLAQLEFNEPPPAADVGEFPVVAEHDFRVGRMGMGFSPSDRTVILYTYELGADDDEDADPSLRVRLTQAQCAALSVQLDEIIAGGRPTCPLCGLPIDTAGHVCVRSNGHSKQAIPEEDEGEDES